MVSINSYKYIVSRTIALLALVTILTLLFSSIVIGKNADIFNVSGGYDGQSVQAIEALETCDWDWQWGQQIYPSTDVSISFSTRYWNEPSPFGDLYAQSQVLKSPLDGDYLYWDTDHRYVIGYASYPVGDIHIRPSINGVKISDKLLNEVAIHEAFHARVAFVFMKNFGSISIVDNPVFIDFGKTVYFGVPPEVRETNWSLLLVEALAESERVYYSSNVPMENEYVRTQLNVPTESMLIAWHNYWCYKTGAKPTPPTPDPTAMYLTVADGPFRVPPGMTQPFNINGTSSGPGRLWFIPTDGWVDWLASPQEIVDSKQWNLYMTPYWPDGYGPLLLKYKIVKYQNETSNLYLNKQDYFDVIGTPYKDVDANDWLQYNSTWYTRNLGLMFGKTETTFDLWNNITKRHIYLIMQRAGLYPPATWNNNYAFATRGEIHNVLPELTFLEERWNENITRFQIAILIERGKFSGQR